MPSSAQTGIHGLYKCSTLSLFLLFSTSALAITPNRGAGPANPGAVPPPPLGEGTDTVLDRIKLERYYAPVTPTIQPKLVQAASEQRARIAHGEGSGREWRSLGPTNANKVNEFGDPTNYTIHEVDSGRVRKIRTRPGRSDQVYLLSASGGLWRGQLPDVGQDKGLDWVPLTDNIGSTMGGSFAFGAGGQTIHLGAGDPFEPGIGGFMVSSVGDDDRWSDPVQLPGASSIQAVEVDDGPGREVILVGTDVGMFRSTDHGKTYGEVGHAQMGGAWVWSLVRSSAGWIAAVSRSQDANDLLDGVGELYASFDRGATWSRLPDLPGEPSGIPGFTLTAGRITLGVGAPGDRVVYAFAATQYNWFQLDLYRSDDGGLTWSPLDLWNKTPKNPTFFQPGMDLMMYQAWYNHMLLVDPDDRSRRTVYLAGVPSVNRTVDGGATWEIVTSPFGPPYDTSGLPYVHMDMHAGWIAHTRSGPVVMVGTDGGFAYSRDAGRTWSQRANTGLVTHQVYSIAGSTVNTDQLLIGLQDNGVRFRVGSTTTWDQVLGSDGVAVAWSEADDSTTMASLETGITLAAYSLPDDMSKWNWVLDWFFQFDAQWYTALYAPRREAALAWDQPRMFGTCTWHLCWFAPDATYWYPFAMVGESGLEPDMLFQPFHNFAMAPFDPARGGAVANHARVGLATDPNSNDWTVVHLDALIPGYVGYNSSMSWATNDVIYVSSVNPDPAGVHMARSTDDGLTWAAADNGLHVPVDIVRGDASDPTGNTAYAGTWLGVYATRDGGAHWKLLGHGLPQGTRVRDLQLARDGSFLRVATDGRGVWEIALR